MTVTHFSEKTLEACTNCLLHGASFFFSAKLGESFSTRGLQVSPTDIKHTEAMYRGAPAEVIKLFPPLLLPGVIDVVTSASMTAVQFWDDLFIPGSTF